MRIIALADTHSEPLPKVLEAELKQAGLIVHVGDFCEPEVYRHLKAIHEVRAVYGNMDGAELRKALPKVAVFECEGVRIGLAHGDGSYDSILPRLRELFCDQKVAVVVYGHSHVAQSDMIDGVLYFNPGSPTDTIRAPYRSYGVLDIKDGKVKAHIVKIR